MLHLLVFKNPSVDGLHNGEMLERNIRENGEGSPCEGAELS
jgi:hypothetical protein